MQEAKAVFSGHQNLRLQQVRELRQTRTTGVLILNRKFMRGGEKKRKWGGADESGSSRSFREGLSRWRLNGIELSLKPAGVICACRENRSAGALLLLLLSLCEACLFTVCVLS